MKYLLVFVAGAALGAAAPKAMPVPGLAMRQALYTQGNALNAQLPNQVKGP